MLVYWGEPDFAGLTVATSSEGEAGVVVEMDVLTGLETRDDLAALGIEGFDGAEEETEVNGGVAYKVVGESGGEGDEDAYSAGGLALEGGGRGLFGLCHRGLFGVCHTGICLLCGRRSSGEGRKEGRKKE